MRRSVEALNRFYADTIGVTARKLIQARLIEAWPDVRELDVLGLGYATPYLDQFSEARRVIAAMPAQQGAEIWPQGRRVKSVLIDEQALPFMSAMFDRILLVHALEDSADHVKLLCEAARLLSPSGRVIVVVAARGGLWAHADHTPFGHGLPFSRRQLEEALREAELEPMAWSYALFAPPMRSLMRWAPFIEDLALRFLPFSGGLILMEAARKPFVALNQPVPSTLMSELKRALTPQPIPSSNRVHQNDRL